MSVAKEIEGYPDYYVSSAGNVWRKHRNEFYLRLRPSKKGQVQLCTNGKCKDIQVYRLVAQAFVSIPEQYQGMSINELEVHHVDFNHSNNRASNLQWLTKAEHMQLHSESDVTSLRKSEAFKGRLLTEEHKRKLSAALKGRQRPEGSGTPPMAVIQYTTEGEYIATYSSVSDAARQTKVDNSNICKCCKGKCNSAGGFKWKYA